MKVRVHTLEPSPPVLYLPAERQYLEVLTLIALRLKSAATFPGEDNPKSVLGSHIAATFM